MRCTSIQNDVANVADQEAPYFPEDWFLPIVYGEATEISDWVSISASSGPLRKEANVNAELVSEAKTNGSESREYDGVLPAVSKTLSSEMVGGALSLQDALNLSETQGDRSFAMPGSIYGAIMTAHVLTTCKSWSDYWHIRGESWCRLLLNNAMQTACLYALWQITLWQFDELDRGNCFKMNLLIFLVCEGVFLMNILTEVADALEMFEFILHSYPRVDGQSQPFQYGRDDNDELVLKSGGISKGFKTSLLLFVALPRIGFAFGMVIVGGYFLQSAGNNTNLFMNALAANFVLEIDELIYAFLTPAFKRDIISAMPVFAHGKSRVYMSIHRWLFLVKMAISVGLVVFFVVTVPPCEIDPCDDAIRSCPLFGLHVYIPSGTHFWP